MKSFLNKIQFHYKRILFQKFSIPKIINDNISKRILKKYLPKNPVIIDCGAHYGGDSIELAIMLKGEVHSFEPVKSLYKILLSNTKNYPNISCYNVALSDTTGKRNFYVSEGKSDASSSLMEPAEHLQDHPDTFFNTITEVDCLTLDNWAMANNIEKIDMLWLDMQGYEMKMLMKSDTILNTVTLIHTEVSLKETYKDVPQYVVFRKFLESKGFEMLFEAIPLGCDMGNVVFHKKNNENLKN